MDQIKIGRFIAERRKIKNMTQAHLAEKMNVTDRAVSKWERGRCLPDSAIMLDLCRELGISVNDLLNGEVITMENTNEKYEKQLLELVKQKEEADKRLLLVEIIIGIFAIAVMLGLCVIAAYAPIEDWLRITLIIIGFVPVLVLTPFMLKIEQTAGYYECKECHHKYIPAYKSVFVSMHMGRTRYMKCPECGKRSWQKKVISKDL
ncbi:MAG: helix-turn-helix transcriptional regulator [Clostridia bacterium]|nr:helix-turn-helix transcriptional regulator [Clostridia bacterium]